MRNVSEKIIVGSRESLLAKQHIKILKLLLNITENRLRIKIERKF